MIRQAGFASPTATVEDVGGGREALMVRRFDTQDSGQRYHMMTANALLKESSACDDPVFPDYMDLVGLIQRHSVDPASDFKQLFAQVLLNQHLNNRDDHLRNFSFLNGPEGFRLAPAYDVVPSYIAGSYPALGYKGMVTLPDCNSAANAAKAFHLTRNEALAIARAVRDVIAQWQHIMHRHNVAERDTAALAHVINQA